MVGLVDLENVTIFYPFSTRSLIDLIASIVVLVCVNIFVDFFVKRKFVVISNAIASLAFIAVSIFKLDIARIVLLFTIMSLSVVSIFINLAETRYLLANKASQRANDKGLNKKAENDTLFSHEDLYKTINDVTLYLSKHKIGAIMTFERKDNLTDVSKNGTILFAPVNYELLITIFYPGTRLHDGAVVIRGNTILAASVYYTPTTKPLIGKYGSRHRAAIGISDICDAVTVVVSEETGRISIAYNGELESYSSDNFYKAFVNIMSETDVLSADASTGGHEIEE
ncbi:MAG: diadenylate cyclase [Bacilli bacterium]|nr:diadenylate cyclase [Bacilli bacterium]